MAEELKRIDPKAIPALFEKHNIRPMQGLFYDKRKDQDCGCVNTVLAVDGGDREAAIKVADSLVVSSQVAALEPFTGLHPFYAYGLASGWDESRHFIRGESPEADLGYEDGKAAVRLCRDFFSEGVAQDES